MFRRTFLKSLASFPFLSVLGWGRKKKTETKHWFWAEVCAHKNKGTYTVCEICPKADELWTSCLTFCEAYEVNGRNDVPVYAKVIAYRTQADRWAFQWPLCARTYPDDVC